MSRCSYCRCELPGLETLCQQCFEAGCDRIAHPKQWWQRFQLRPQFTRDNFIGFSLLFTVSFASLRFDFPYFHARHMWNTETSALIATLIGCLAFFHHGGDKSEVGPTRAKKFDQRMNWKRFALLGRRLSLRSFHIHAGRRTNADRGGKLGNRCKRKFDVPEEQKHSFASLRNYRSCEFFFRCGVANYD